MGIHHSFGRMLENPTLPHRRQRDIEWMIASARVAEELMDRWRREDSGDDDPEAGDEAAPNPDHIRLVTIWTPESCDEPPPSDAGMAGSVGNDGPDSEPPF